MKQLIFIALVAMVPHALAQCSYAQFGSTHTMCKHKDKACPRQGGCRARGVTQSDITAILKTHNDYRNTVAIGQQAEQPKAANMREMKWDDEISTIAQRWADQCTFGHDENRRTANNSWVGQNVALTASTGTGTRAEFPGAITMWYNEVGQFNKSQINPFQFTSDTGHYSQVVWAETDRVGCGYSSYTNRQWFWKLYVCNYAPGGNEIGAVMYLEGEPATACTSGKSATYPGLCAS